MLKFDIFDADQLPFFRNVSLRNLFIYLFVYVNLVIKQLYHAKYGI